MASHAEEVAAGAVWTPCGYRSETAALRSVLLVRPPDSVGAVRRPGASLMVGPVDLPAMRAQCDALADRLRDDEVEVHLAAPEASPNVVFARDLFWMTPAGAVLARMASAQRAGEERHAALALAGAGSRSCARSPAPPSSRAPTRCGSIRRRWSSEPGSVRTRPVRPRSRRRSRSWGRGW
ncbi:hypothetical protein [Streptomyces griseus]|uniref:hypothetical protein n=1 Tax=Streptomyces griseus TaxID=1911 RepID=UPI0033B13B72